MIDINYLSDSLRNYLGKDSKIKIYRVTDSIIDVTAISNRFTKMSTEERKGIIEKWDELNNNSLKVGFVTAYTPIEAKELEINLNNTFKIEEKPSTWFDLTNITCQKYQPNRNLLKPKVVAFYSFKGGVGRTTAMVNVAWILSAERNKKVVLIDLDLEAPSLHQIIGELKIEPKYGLVDYLYERSNNIDDFEIGVTDIIGEISVPKGSLFIIPAGKFNIDYVAKVDDLKNLPIYDDSLWTEFKSNLIEQLEPDFVLVDSRTGINIWGALSILNMSDDSIIFMNPTPQNTEGILVILKLLNNVNIQPNIVFSPVLGGKIAKERAMKEWQKIVDYFLHNEDVIEEFDDNDIDEPIMIPYSNEIALSDEYPCRSFNNYNDVANLIDEGTDKNKLVNILSGYERWNIITSLDFSPVDAKMEEETSVKELFQKTADFDRFLDPSVVLIKGKKGTGKTQLYSTSIKHYPLIKQLAQGRIDNVIMISGHGSTTNRPMKEDFSYINNKFGTDDLWESFWRVYAFYQLASLTFFRRGKNFESIRQILKNKPRDTKTWTLEHTKFIIELVKDSNKRLIIRDALNSLDNKLYAKNQAIWLLYDDLDQDIPERSYIQKNAISGLFAFALSLDSLKYRNIRTKIFLRTDIWSSLNFTNKSHFVGRDVELKWSREDFLRMALRQAERSAQFHELVNRFNPIQEINQASEESLERTLALLWGIDRERGRKSKKVSRWVYERLTDANGSTFPRALIYLLEGAKEKELEYQNMSGVPAPQDRLLRAQSMNAGLIRASDKRCDELRQEYKELDDIGFFKFLNQVRQTSPKSILQQWWEDKATSIFGTFAEFYDHIKSMGLADDNKDGDVRFADLYVHGFNINRIGKY